MKKIDKIIMWLLILSFPVLVGLMIWVSVSRVVYVNHGPVNSIFGVIFVGWVVLAIIFLIRLLVSSDLREKVLTKVARIQERDEREVEVSGYAAKFSFFANLALLVCLLFFSSLSFEFKKTNQGYIDSNGIEKHGYFSMRFDLKAYDDKAVKYVNDDLGKELNYSDLPFSKSGIIILLILWQIGAYHFSARKKLKVD